ncbi:MAG TPA: prepilin-type N-terminal cleavage/methylation domain-containing protein [Pseudomonadota bacterium]|jgi:general secretion pathway protein I|nr:prepilin-type N-terminal cleavage/methylation domain-containing protein [Pseudomonadota bacterium]
MRPLSVRRTDAGFTLLEVMIAMAILSMALVSLYLATGRAIRVSRHARSMTQATFLCRQKMSEIQNEFVTEGFKDDAGQKEERGEFQDPGFQTFRYETVIEKIRLPATDQMQAAATKLLQDKQTAAGGQKGATSTTSSSAGTGGLGGSMSGFLGPVKEMLEQGIRKVTVRVKWDEPGLPDQQVEVVAFFTDVRKAPLSL